MILSLLLLSPMNSTGRSTAQSPNPAPNQSSGPLSLYFQPALSDLDEKTSTLYTNRVVLGIASEIAYTGANYSFAGVMIYTSEEEPIQPQCDPVGNYSSSGGQWRNNLYSWSDSGYSFYNGPFLWHLFYAGTFPYDEYHWPFIIGTDFPLMGSDPLQSLGNFPYNFTSKWQIELSKLIPLSGSPDNNTLERLWPGLGFYIPAYCTSTFNIMKTHANWYYFDTVFKRLQTDKIRLGMMFWIPSAGLFATLLGSWMVYGWARLRKRKFRIRLAEGLTLYLTSALFAVSVHTFHYAIWSRSGYSR